MDNNNQKTANWFIDQLNIYQSANSDHQSIKNNFIIRKVEFSIIVDAILNKKPKDPLQHELILGRRGSGKSTLLKRIEIEILENEKLNKKYIPINLAEEQAGIYRLFDLWEQVLEELKHKLDIKINLKEYGTFKTNQNYTRYLYTLIHEICIKNKKRIVLLLDNFDRIVENFDDDGNLLRETLINHNDIQIIAGSTRMDEHFWRHDMPFYEFFRRHRLEALSKEEMNTLLMHWSNSLGIAELKEFVKYNPGKIENIRILTDGLPRTLQFFIQIVLQKSESSTYEYLKKTMDNVSPLYQERLNSLTAQIRKIVLEMSFIWEACTTKQLVEKTKMESKLISANLTTLVAKGIVDKIETQKKQHLYRLSERFFNMWLIITQGNPEQKRKAKWLSIFLENWYDAADFKKLAKEHIANLKNKNIDWNKALIFSKALSQSKHISLNERDTIIELTENIKEAGLENCLIELPKRYKVILSEIVKLEEDENYEKAIELADSIENEEDGIKFYILAILYNKQEKQIEAEKYYLLAIEKGDIDALNNLGTLYNDQGKQDEAERYYLLSIGQGNVNALNNLALLYKDQEKEIEAEKYYLLTIEKGNVEALNNLAKLYYDKNINKVKALKYLNQYVIKKNNISSNKNLIIAEIWNGIFNDVENRIIAIIKEKNADDLNDFIFDLFVHQQKNIVLNLFQNKEIGMLLQEKYTVLYYVTLLLNKVQYDNLYLRIPPEIQSTIDDVMKNIEEKEKFYGYR